MANSALWMVWMRRKACAGVGVICDDGNGEDSNVVGWLVACLAG